LLNADHDVLDHWMHYSSREMIVQKNSMTIKTLGHKDRLKMYYYLPNNKESV